MWQSSILLLSGAAAGALLALAATSGAQSLLFGVKSNDLATFLGATFFLVVVALAASFIPARRASRLDPGTALRYE
jgi:ABC-type antimicrobial peptide transport system permease subunit